MLLLWIAVLVLLLVSSQMNNGHLVYSYDDAYIHMSMAKNFALHGVWGISKYGFTSSSSSLIWTALVAFIYLITGVNEITPLIINIVLSTIIVFSAYIILKRLSVKPLYISLALTALIILTPLPPLILTGLEHPLHILVSILFVYVSSGTITGEKKGFLNSLLLVFLSILLPSIRYEGIVLVIVTAILFLFRKQWKLSIIMVILSALPIYIFGIISISKGWSFFPNSLLLKGDFPDIITFGDFFNLMLVQWSKIFNKVSTSGALVTIILAVSLIVLYLKQRKKVRLLGSNNAVMLILLGINIVLYLLFSRTGWSYRYQLFLIALAIFIFSVILFKYASMGFNNVHFLRSKAVRLFALLLLLLLGIYFSFGGVTALIQTPRMTTNIYEQQYQMGLFLKKFYENKTIALNDIGACNYFADIHCVDLWGLGDLEISKKRRYNSYVVNDLREAAHSQNIDIAIVYDAWFSDGNSSLIPREWVRVGQWGITNNIIAGGDTISFYAVDINKQNNLFHNLESFSQELPPAVIQTGDYTKLHR